MMGLMNMKSDQSANLIYLQSHFDLLGHISKARKLSAQSFEISNVRNRTRDFHLPAARCDQPLHNGGQLSSRAYIYDAIILA